MKREESQGEKEKNGAEYYLPNIMKIYTSPSKGLRISKKGNGVQFKEPAIHF